MRRAITLGVLLLSGGCSDGPVIPAPPPPPPPPVAPDPPSPQRTPISVQVGGPTSTRGNTAFSEYRCEYRVSAQADTATHGDPARWTGATWTIEPLAGDPREFKFSGSASAGDVASWFGTAEFAPGQTRKAVLQTRLTFSGSEITGSTGAHRATWVFAYTSAGEARTARYAVDCLPSIRDVLVIVQEAGSERRVSGVQVVLGERQTITDHAGFARFSDVIIGRYPLSIRSPRFRPVSDTVIVGGGLPPPFRYDLVRIAPRLERVEFTCPDWCTMVLVWYDPAGVASLPRETSVAVSGTAGYTATLTTVTAADLDGNRRRYTMSRTSNSALEMKATLSNASNLTVRVDCKRSVYAYDWECVEQPD